MEDKNKRILVLIFGELLDMEECQFERLETLLKSRPNRSIELLERDFFDKAKQYRNNHNV